jgi:amino acid transporter
MKILAFFLIVITSLVVDLGGGPSGERLGFRYWNNPGPWIQYAGIVSMVFKRFDEFLADVRV